MQYELHIALIKNIDSQRTTAFGVTGKTSTSNNSNYPTYVKLPYTANLDVTLKDH